MLHDDVSILNMFHLFAFRSSTAVRFETWVYCDFITLNTEL
jgi:hypothetical protein